MSENLVFLKRKLQWDMLCFCFRDVRPAVLLNEVLEFSRKKQGLSHTAELSSNLHVWPDYHGNRSPLSDSSLTGMVRNPIMVKMTFHLQSM